MKSLKVQMLGGCLDAIGIAFIEIVIGLLAAERDLYLITAILSASSLLSVANAVNRYQLYRGLNLD